VQQIKEKLKSVAPLYCSADYAGLAAFAAQYCADRGDRLFGSVKLLHNQFMRLAHNPAIRVEVVRRLPKYYWSMIVS
jgi:hypothetical protein